MTDTPARVGAVMINCHDPSALMEFWSQIIGIEIDHEFPGYIFGTRIPGNHIRLAFQKVPEDKSVKNRLHLDMSHEDPEALIVKVESLGGSRIEDHELGGFTWTVLADPEGNEFCVTPQS
jgi:predicted enzyme related to lactoylglutathione lyase